MPRKPRKLAGVRACARHFSGRRPGEGDQSGSHVGERPTEIKPRGCGCVVVQVDPVPDVGYDRTRDQEKSQAKKQSAGATVAGEEQTQRHSP